MMSTFDKVYQKFENLEEQFLSSGQSRTDFIAERFGGDLEIGVTILTDAIMKDNLTESKDIERFSFLKDLFSFLLKHKDTIDMLPGFDMATEDVSEIEDILSKLALTMTTPYHAPVLSQKELYEQKGLLHYEVTPDSVTYTALDNCHAFYVSSENFAILLKAIKGVPTNLKMDTVYIDGKRGLRQCKKSELLPYLTNVCGD